MSMNASLKRTAVGALVAVAALSGAAALGSPGGGSSETGPSGYFVDGARPSDGADAATGAGCVYWSEGRLDVAICGELPAGWEPLPPPSYDAEICARALQVLGAKAADTERLYGVLPSIAPSSCVAQQRRDGHDWYVVFDVVDSSAAPYQSVLVAIDLDGQLPDVVSLS